MTQPNSQPERTAPGPLPVSGAVQAALWLIVVLLAVNATVLLLQRSESAAWAQPGGAAAAARADASGVFVVPAQVDKDQWGAYLVDTRAGTVVLYLYSPAERRLKLTAARTFVYDRYLENYNTDPPPSEIAEIISKARLVRPGQPPPGGTDGGPTVPDGTNP